MSDDLQPELYPRGILIQENQIPVGPNTSIQATLGAFEHHMEEAGFAVNTRKAFASDIGLLGRYLGVGQPVGEIGTKNLNDFLQWLRYERGIPCSNKSYARRVTTLKVFFSWLHQSGVLPSDPAEPVIQISVSSPLPQVPTQDELARALSISSAIRDGTLDKKPDARPHLLLTLLLATGIKKVETLALTPNHIDRSSPDAPYVYIRYSNPKLRQKERKISVNADWLDILDDYLDQYEPGNALFTCTARNLEYILSDLGERADLAQGTLSFENLRWAAALNDLREGMESEQIRYKLGLSPVTWRVTHSKLEKLIERQGGLP